MSHNDVLLCAATFMLDTGDELWLWLGWWPETATAADDPDSSTGNGTANGDAEEPSSPPPPPSTAAAVTDHRGSSSTRLQAERRAAMQTALDYWRRKHGDDADEDPKAYMVWAGLEPLRFTRYFPEWCEREDVAEINAKVSGCVSFSPLAPLIARWSPRYNNNYENAVAVVKLHVEVLGVYTRQNS